MLKWSGMLKWSENDREFYREFAGDFGGNLPGLAGWLEVGWIAFAGGSSFSKYSLTHPHAAPRANIKYS
jgi:hypothetical protein